MADELCIWAQPCGHHLHWPSGCACDDDDYRDACLRTGLVRECHENGTADTDGDGDGDGDAGGSSSASSSSSSSAGESVCRNRWSPRLAQRFFQIKVGKNVQRIELLKRSLGLGLGLGLGLPPPLVALCVGYCQSPLVRWEAWLEEEFNMEPHHEEPRAKQSARQLLQETTGHIPQCVLGSEKKSALAVRWSCRLLDRFQLWLRGWTDDGSASASFVFLRNFKLDDSFRPARGTHAGGYRSFLRDHALTRTGAMPANMSGPLYRYVATGVKQGHYLPLPAEDAALGEHDAYRWSATPALADPIFSVQYDIDHYEVGSAGEVSQAFFHSMTWQSGASLALLHTKKREEEEGCRTTDGDGGSKSETPAESRLWEFLPCQAALTNTSPGGALVW